MDEKTLTFDELCEAEPELRRLYMLASMIGRKRGKDFCANFVWYEFIKPELCAVVGRNRTARPMPDKTQNPFDNPVDILKALSPKGEDMVDRGKENKFITDYNKASYCKDPILWSSRAYDIAYETIYNALPDCRHDNGSVCA